MRATLIAAGLAMAVAAGAAPAWAEHGAESSSVDLDVDLRVDRDGFRVAGQLLGLGKVYGAWLNGRMRADGLSLDGRVQEGSRALNFKLNAEIARRWLDAFGRNPI
jgi:hypothetical protein